MFSDISQHKGFLGRVGNKAFLVEKFYTTQQRVSKYFHKCTNYLFNYCNSITDIKLTFGFRTGQQPNCIANHWV